jgi:hypothetical protein
MIKSKDWIIDGMNLYVDDSMEDDEVFRGGKDNKPTFLLCNEKTANKLISKEKIKQREEKLKNILEL